MYGHQALKSITVPMEISANSRYNNFVGIFHKGESRMKIKLDKWGRGTWITRKSHVPFLN